LDVEQHDHNKYKEYSETNHPVSQFHIQQVFVVFNHCYDYQQKSAQKEQSPDTILEVIADVGAPRLIL
jgi:hypothetical protein